MRLCDRHGCTQAGTHPAPKAPNKPDCWMFCLSHATEYNRGWDYFQGLSAEELGRQGATALPDKEVVSILDLNADVNLAVDAAAPIDLAVAANANVAAPIDAAVGRTCAELVAPYPPGIPVLAPGERISAEVVTALRAARSLGLRVAYAADPSLTTLRVLRDVPQGTG